LELFYVEFTSLTANPLRNYWKEEFLNRFTESKLKQLLRRFKLFSNPVKSSQSKVRKFILDLVDDKYLFDTPVPSYVLII
jgi:hypothetical protein